MISKDLLAILACPVCESRPPFRLEEDKLICDLGRHYFVISEGIPNLLPDSAKPLEEGEE